MLDKTCWHMLRTFPRNTLNKSHLLWNKVSVAPLPPEQCCNKCFPSSTGNLEVSELCARLQINIVRRERGFMSTILSKIVVGLWKTRRELSTKSLAGQYNAVREINGSWRFAREPFVRANDSFSVATEDTQITTTILHFNRTHFQ